MVVCRQLAFNYITFLFRNVIHKNSDNCIAERFDLQDRLLHLQKLYM